MRQIFLVACTALACASALAAQGKTRGDFPTPAAKPGILTYQFVDTLRWQALNNSRVTLLEPAGRGAPPVIRADWDGVVHIDSLRSGRVIVRINSIGFDPLIDTVRFDAARGLVRRPVLKYAVLRMTRSVVTGEGPRRTVTPR